MLDTPQSTSPCCFFSCSTTLKFTFSSNMDLSWAVNVIINEHLDFCYGNQCWKSLIATDVKQSCGLYIRRQSYGKIYHQISLPLRYWLFICWGNALLLLIANNFLALSIYSLVPWSVIARGISSPINLLCGSVTLQDIDPPFLELIFFSKCLTVISAFLTLTAKGS